MASLAVVASLAVAGAGEAAVAGNFVQISVAAMAVLLGWGVANVGIGLYRCREQDAVRRYFWQMNLAWGAVAALLAAFTLKALAANYEKFVSDAAFQNQQTNIVGLNVLLDIGYVVVGLAMIRYKAKGRTERRYGYGRSIVVQGGFLLVFDAALFALLKFSG